MTKLSEFLQQAHYFYDPSNRDPLGIELVIAFALGKKREKLIIDCNQILTENEIEACQQLLERFAAGEPFAYIVHHKEFYGLNFYVDKTVLIPRPETEMLVDEVVDFVKKDFELTECTVVDVGTGSGCIALALAYHLSSVRVVATDISEKALLVAKKNVEKYSLTDRVILRHADLLEAIKPALNDGTDVQSFDIVVANLPYIGTGSYKFVSQEAYDYEPHVALFGGDNGLQLYQKLFIQLSEKLWQPKLIVGEFGYLQREPMQELLQKFYPDQWKIKKDLAGIERIFIIKPADVM